MLESVLMQLGGKKLAIIFVSVVRMVFTTISGIHNILYYIQRQLSLEQQPQYLVGNVNIVLEICMAGRDQAINLSFVHHVTLTSSGNI